MSNLRRVGAEAEDRAAAHLLEQGYTIVTRRFKARRGEIDIIAYDGDTLVFVEVKFRKGVEQPELAVDDRKLELLYESAQEYLSKSDIDPSDVRLDVIAIDDRGLRHLKNAFG